MSVLDVIDAASKELDKIRLRRLVYQKIRQINCKYDALALWEFLDSFTVDELQFEISKS